MLWDLELIWELTSKPTGSSTPLSNGIFTGDSPWREFACLINPTLWLLGGLAVGLKRRPPKLLPLVLTFLVALFSIVLGYTAQYYDLSGLQHCTGHDPMGVLDSFYFATTTFTTVGYGDITPTTQTCRFLATTEAWSSVLYLGAFLSVAVSVIVASVNGDIKSAPNTSKGRPSSRGQFEPLTKSDRSLSRAYGAMLIVPVVLGVFLKSQPPSQVKPLVGVNFVLCGAVSLAALLMRRAALATSALTTALLWTVVYVLVT